MSEVKHTPTPWIYDGYEVYSDDCEYHPVANSTPNHTCRDDEEGIANAAHIVKCVNMHDELVEALKLCGKLLENGGFDLNFLDETLKKAGAI